MADIFFTTIFSLEMLIKCIALGCFAKPFRRKRVWTRFRDDLSLQYWTELAYEAILLMHSKEPAIINIPGLAIEVQVSSADENGDSYQIVHVWGPQDLRIIFINEEFFTAYLLRDIKKGEWVVWNKEQTPKDTNLIQVATSYDMTDYHHNAYFASNWNRFRHFYYIHISFSFFWFFSHSHFLFLVLRGVVGINTSKQFKKKN